VTYLNINLYLHGTLIQNFNLYTFIIHFSFWLWNISKRTIMIILIHCQYGFI
jgi:hypothetical protein